MSRSTISDFKVTNEVGQARAGELTIKGTSLKTPNLFPVISVYGGGRATSMFGGGLHRTIKEFMVGHERVFGGDYSEYFPAIMSSVSALTDYGLNEDITEYYLETPMKERPEFSAFDGLLFIDSGGFKFLTQDDEGQEILKITPERAFRIQRQMGADIIINLDYPIHPDDSYHERVRKARSTAENTKKFLELSTDYEAARFLTIHGYTYSMIHTYLNEFTDVIPKDTIIKSVDGIALGSLVPIKDNKGKLLQAVMDCRDVLDEFGFGQLPFHVLGISNGSIPLLAAMGVDTFDSSSYLQAAINHKYSTSLVGSVPIELADFDNCNCDVCSDDRLVDWMRGNTEYQKDILGAVAMHNLIIQMEEMRRIREIIQAGEREELVRYIDELGRESRRLRDYSHKVVNESLGGYF